VVISANPGKFYPPFTLLSNFRANFLHLLFKPTSYMHFLFLLTFVSLSQMIFLNYLFVCHLFQKLNPAHNEYRIVCAVVQYIAFCCFEEERERRMMRRRNRRPVKSICILYKLHFIQKQWLFTYFTLISPHILNSSFILLASTTKRRFSTSRVLQLGCTSKHICANLHQQSRIGSGRNVSFFFLF
jgi:hypothetical protein